MKRVEHRQTSATLCLHHRSIFFSISKEKRWKKSEIFHKGVFCSCFDLLLLTVAFAKRNRHSVGTLRSCIILVIAGLMGCLQLVESGNVVFWSCSNLWWVDMVSISSGLKKFEISVYRLKIFKTHSWVCSLDDISVEMTWSSIIHY